MMEANDEVTGNPDPFNTWFILYSAITFFACLVIFQFLTPRLSDFLIPSYRHLPEDDRVKWKSACMGLVFCACVCSAALYGFVADQELYVYPIWGTSTAAPLVYGLCMGCMLFDIIIMLLNPSALFKKEMILHHVTVVAAVTVAAFTGAGAFFIFYRSLHELSTIYLKFMACFKILKLDKKSPLVLTNSIVFLITFFLCRIAVMPVFWYAYIHGYLSIVVQPPTFVLYQIGISGLIIDILNLYWFCIIIRGTVNLFKGQSNLLPEEIADDDISSEDVV